MSNSEEVLLSVRNGRVFLSRYITESDGSFFWESATNMADLEADVLAAIAQQGGSINQDGDYTCPADLAARAHWFEETL